ncbi:MAG: cytochrome c biogenesis protein CcdA [Candidatus Woykebacteria bacterium]
MTEVPIIFAFVAGLISFLSPCVLPLVPAFLSYLSGTNIAEAENRRAEIFITTIFYVLGFTLIFSLLGVLLNTILESIAFDAQAWLSRVGGILIIFFGLYLMEFIHLPFLEREHRFNVQTKFKSKYLTAFVFGAAFAAGWTPCVGAVLGAILGLAATAPGSAFVLLFSYSLGLALPFLVVGLFAASASRLISKYAKAMRYIRIVFGAVLLGIGVLVFTQNLARFANVESLINILQ